MSAYTMAWEPLTENGRELGQIGLVPWDCEIFGVAVASFRLGDAAAMNGAPAGGAAFDRWCSAHDAVLVSCGVSSNDAAANRALQRAGFAFVELALEARVRASRVVLPRTKTALRRASAEDWPGIEAIAASAFRHGRYHADPQFPKELADRRYVAWMRNARAAGDVVYVTGEPGDPRGFFHATLRDGVADLRLGAVDARRSSGILGPALYGGVVADLRELGARTIVARISAANVAVLNLYAAMGFLFSDAENVYHRNGMNNG